MYFVRLWGLPFGLLVVLLVNIQLLSSRWSVHWDAYDEMWPYLRWMGSAFREGYFPDFFPNIVLGFPIGANIQSGVYNIFYGLISFVFAESILSVNILYLITQMVCFAMAYGIARTYELGVAAAFFFGLTMVGNGFFVGHAEHFSYLATAVGLLGVFLGLRWLIRGCNVAGAFLVVVSSYHMLTAGYPSNILFGGICLAIYSGVVWLQHREYRSQIGIMLGASLLGVLLAIPSLLHFFHQLSQSNRGEGLDVPTAVSGSMPLYSILNLLHPTWHMRFGEPSMERFHLLHLGMPLIVVAVIWRFKLGAGRYQVGLWLVLALCLTLLALGNNSPVPIRVWLAENFFLFRAGRFPSGEHRGIALFFLGLLAAVGFQYVWISLKTPLIRLAMVFLVVIDFAGVMMANRSMRYAQTPIEDRGKQSLYRVAFGAKEQPLIDAPRLCPPDGPHWEKTAIHAERHLPPNSFYWNGYTNLKDKTYDAEKDVNRDLLCGPSRFWYLDSRTPAPYILDIYTPGRIRFTVAGSDRSQEIIYLWTDYDDGYWTLLRNDEPAAWLAAPMKLRAFKARPGDIIEMTYKGPLSRLWR